MVCAGAATASANANSHCGGLERASSTNRASASTSGSASATRAARGLRGVFSKAARPSHSPASAEHGPPPPRPPRTVRVRRSRSVLRESSPASHVLRAHRTHLSRYSHSYSLAENRRRLAAACAAWAALREDELFQNTTNREATTPNARSQSRTTRAALAAKPATHRAPGKSATAGMPAEEEPVNMEGRETPQQFCLRWNNYQSNLTSCFDQLLQTELFVDVTLACEGQKLKAHKLVLSACSPYFQELLIDNPCQHPIIIMNNDIKYCDLKAVVYYMYRGEINVSEDQIPTLLKVAEALKIRGLTDVSASQSMLHEESRAHKRTMAREKSPQPERARRRLSEGREAAGSHEARRGSPGSPPTAPADLSGSRGGSPGDAPPPPPMPPLPTDDADIRPGIAEMIREEERARLIENSHAWLGPSTSAIADSYQYQLQSMWQKCWNTNQNLVHNLRFRERGPLKSWRPETMAEAIFSVLKEGLSLSQAARKYDIPYPTFVLYANRVHNMLGPSADGGADLRPKGRGRPQRILLGVWPDEHIRGVIRAVVFRDTHAPHANPHHLREIDMPAYPAITDGTVTSNAYAGVGCGNGREERVSPNAAAAAAVAAVAHGLRRQMCNMVVAAQRPPDQPPHLGLPSLPLQSPRLPSPLSSGLESPLCSPLPPGQALEPAKPADPFRPFISPRPDSRFGDASAVEPMEMGPPKTPVPTRNGQPAPPMELEAPADERGDI